MLICSKGFYEKWYQKTRISCHQKVINNLKKAVSVLWLRRKPDWNCGYWKCGYCVWCDLTWNSHFPWHHSRVLKKMVIKNGVFGNKKKKSSLLFRRDCYFRVFRVCRTTESMTAGAKTCSQWVFRGTSGHCSSKLNSYPKNVHDLWDCRYMQQKWASSETSLVQLRVELIFLHTERRQLRGFSIWPGSWRWPGLNGYIMSL